MTIPIVLIVVKLLCASSIVYKAVQISREHNELKESIASVRTSIFYLGIVSRAQSIAVQDLSTALEELEGALRGLFQSSSFRQVSDISNLVLLGLGFTILGILISLAELGYYFISGVASDIQSVLGPLMMGLAASFAASCLAVFLSYHRGHCHRVEYELPTIQLVEEARKELIDFALEAQSARPATVEDIIRFNSEAATRVVSVHSAAMAKQVGVAIEAAKEELAKVHSDAKGEIAKLGIELKKSVKDFVILFQAKLDALAPPVANLVQVAELSQSRLNQATTKGTDLMEKMSAVGSSLQDAVSALTTSAQKLEATGKKLENLAALETWPKLAEASKELQRAGVTINDGSQKFLDAHIGLRELTRSEAVATRTAIEAEFSRLMDEVAHATRATKTLREDGAESIEALKRSLVAAASAYDQVRLSFSETAQLGALTAEREETTDASLAELKELIVKLSADPDRQSRDWESSLRSVDEAVTRMASAAEGIFQRLAVIDERLSLLAEGAADAKRIQANSNTEGQKDASLITEWEMPPGSNPPLTDQPPLAEVDSKGFRWPWAKD